MTGLSIQAEKLLKDAPEYISHAIEAVLSIALASAHVTATASGPEAVRTAETTTGYAAVRTAGGFRLTLQALGDAGRDDAAAALHQAMIRVYQGYWHEGENIRSAKILSVDATSRAAIDALAGNLVETGEPADLKRIRSYSRLIADRDLQWTPTARDEEADRLIPVRKSDASNANPADRLNGFYVLEAHAFTDGKRTVLNIRDALSAEFGPLGSDRVRQVFSIADCGFRPEAK